MQKKTLFLCLMALLMNLGVQAQRYNFPDAPDEFIKRVKEVLDFTKKQASIKAAEAFTEIWNGSLNSTHKEKVIKISKKMEKKRCTAAGQYTHFYSGLAHAFTATKLTSTQLTQFLDVTDKVLDKYATRELVFYFKRYSSTIFF